MVKILSISLLLFSSILAETFAKDKTIIDQLSKKYSGVSSYYTAFEGADNYKGDIYFQAPDYYRISEKDDTTIVKDSIAYKIDPSIRQVIISKASQNIYLYSPIGLVETLKSKFNFKSYNESTKEYQFTALDKYDAIKSISVKINNAFFPEYIIVYTNDDNVLKYTFKNQIANKIFNKNIFEYKKHKDFEEFDIR